MTRLYVTGTDTGVGKTRVTAALARAARDRGGACAIVKLVQTGLAPGAPGDAEVAAELAGCAWHELARFEAPADPWSAALAADREPLRAARLAGLLGALPAPLVVEGSGGAAVPLNADESLSDVARIAGCEAILVVGLRLGCLNHALLTLEYLERRAIAVRGLVLCEAFGATDQTYRRDVRRVLAPHAPVAPFIAFAPDGPSRIADDARCVAGLLARAGETSGAPR